MVPRDLTEIMLMFTDWSQIMSHLGLEAVTSESPLSDRLELLLHILSSGASLRPSHTEPSYTRMRSTCAPIGFAQLELSILNTAYIDEEKTMILSSSPRAVEMFLAVRAGEIASMAKDPFTCAAVEHLNNPASAIVLRGVGECLRFTPNPILDFIGTVPTEERIAELMTMIEEKELLVPYRALGVGYRQEESHPVGAIVFEYDTPELAAMELPVRCLLAHEGMSTYYDAPISESYFTILNSDVQDSAVILTVAPINDQPIRLFRMIFYRDAVFAGCSF